MAGLFGWFTPSPSPAPNYAPGPRLPAHAGSYLEARNLLKGFGQGDTRTLAVNNVGLQLHRNELTLLMGPSGSGKSTLLAMISGLLQPDQGQVLAMNQDLWNRSK